MYKTSREKYIPLVSRSTYSDIGGRERYILVVGGSIYLKFSGKV